ncbi:MAG: hypothetical protein Q8Q73_17195, partial [Stagnimonas sp.]|nr:hypothetical protein [Stagnimonas sp.]
TDFTKNEQHFALASGPEDGPVFLAAQDYKGQLELTARPHMAKTFGTREAAEAALPAFKATPAGNGGNWRVVSLEISTSVRAP